MATTNVPKGAGRAAHKARTEKAAQRTPFPDAAPGPRPAVAVAKAIAAEAKAKKVAKVEAKPAKAEFVKAAEFAVAVQAQDAGWTITKTAKGVRAEVVGTRGDESFHIAWVNNVYERWAGYTGFGAVDKRVPNAKSMLALTARSPQEASASPARAKGAPRGERAATRRSAATATAWEGFGDDASDEEVLAAVKGKKIVWRNTLMIDAEGNATEGAVQEARVPRDEVTEIEIIQDGKKTGRFQKTVRPPKHLKVERNPKGERVFTFAAVEGQFRSVNEKNILQVK